MIIARSARGAKFHNFFDLPEELRKSIYDFALYVGQPIAPHLCNEAKDGIVKFHDDKTHSRHLSHHGFISTFLGITQVCRKVRKEALPCFYSINTFIVGPDTATYFTYLEHLDRFKHIQHVHYLIQMRREQSSAIDLVQMCEQIRKTEIYKSQGMVSFLNTPGLAHEALTDHPEYNVGGLQNLAVFICLRKLIVGCSSDKPGFATKLVVPIPRAQLFEDYPGFRWLLGVARGLGIEIHFVEGKNVMGFDTARGCIVLKWQKTFQKLDGEVEKISGSDQMAERIPGGAKECDTILERTRQMYGDIDGLVFLRWELFLREHCGHHGVKWFDAIH